MTPLEKAVKAAHECGYEGCEGPYVAPFNADDARAIIRAFLEAAAEDDSISNDVGWEVVPLVGDEPFSVIGKAAILALREKING